MSFPVIQTDDDGSYLPPILKNPSMIFNTGTDIFGTSNVFMTSSTTLWKVPAGVTTVRARVWGAGGDGFTVLGANTGTSFNGSLTNVSSIGRGGGGGGFAMGTVNVTAGTNISITVGGPSAATSFGSLVSANGGTSATSTVTGTAGAGTIGDTLATGQKGATGSPASGSYGLGGSGTIAVSPSYAITCVAPGGNGASLFGNAIYSELKPTQNTFLMSYFNIRNPLDLIGTGTPYNNNGADSVSNIVNGLGARVQGHGSTPGGGGAGIGGWLVESAIAGIGGSGLVIIEY